MFFFPPLLCVILHLLWTRSLSELRKKVGELSEVGMNVTLEGTDEGPWTVRV